MLLSRLSHYCGLHCVPVGISLHVDIEALTPSVTLSGDRVFRRGKSRLSEFNRAVVLEEEAKRDRAHHYHMRTQ